MGAGTTKTSAKEQFARQAAAYVSSPAHALGSDLDSLCLHVGHKRYKKALDIATGGGHTALAVSAFCDEVLATDLTPAMLEEARQHLEGRGAKNVKFQVAEAEQLPFENESFDLVTCRIAPHHFHSIQRFADEAYRVLIPGGTLALIDNIAPQQPELDQFINWVESRRDGSHQRDYTEQEWRDTLARAGFVVVYTELIERRCEFRSWTARAGMSPEDAAQLSHEILSQSPRILAAYDVHKDQATGQVSSFADLKLFAKAIKPPPVRE